MNYSSSIEPILININNASIAGFEENIMSSEANTTDDRKSPSSFPVEAHSFEEQLRDFSKRITFVRDCLRSSQEIISKLQELSQAGVHAFFTEKENQELEDFASKRASVLILGQTNSGKSSFINELLGGTYLPTAEIPCTSRIVRIRNSTNNFTQVQEASGKIVQEKKFFEGKRVPKESIVLDDSKRDNEDWVRCVVVVGLNNPLLQGDHLEFVDAPGMSENEVVDSIIQECLHGILQVVIYVIDGNSSLRVQDRNFLCNLKEKIGFIPIFFVCNKVDLDKKAEDHDRDSDEDEENQKPEAVWENIQEKKRRAFSELVDCGMIRKGTELDSCEFFYGISTREVKRDRNKKPPNRYTCGFEEMKKSFLKFVADSINSHLANSGCLLFRVQSRIFEFFISPNPKRCKLEQMSEVFESIKGKGEGYFEKICDYVKKNQPKLQSMISSEVKTAECEIIKEAEAMEFGPIQIDDASHEPEISKQWMTQLQNMVLLRVFNVSTEKVYTFLQSITNAMKEQLQVSLQSAKKKDYLADKLFEDQIRLIYIGPRKINRMLQMNPFENCLSSKFTYRDKPGRFLVDRKAWKRRRAESVLCNIDYERVSKRIVNALLYELSSNHRSFHINQQCIEELYEKAKDQSDAQQRDVSEEYAPSFAEITCRTEALMQTLSYPDIQLLGQVGRRGNRRTVFNCETNGKFGERKVVAMQVHEKASNVQYMAIQHCLRRWVENNHNSAKQLLRQW